jgi:putative PIN family toxin of toxin-antitoxin system
VRAVCDPNILIAALLSPSGAAAHIMARWLAGDFELVASDMLIAELERALAYPRIRSRIAEEEASALIELLRQAALLAPNPPQPQPRSTDPGDDYLIALAEHERAILVSGDQHPLALAGILPIQTPRAFLNMLTSA